MSKYRLLGEIQALPTTSRIGCRIPAGEVVEYSPSGGPHGRFIEVCWNGTLCTVLLADLFDRGEFIRSL